MKHKNEPTLKDEDYSRYLIMSENNIFYGNYIVPKNIIKIQENELHQINNADNIAGLKSGTAQGGLISEQ